MHLLLEMPPGFRAAFFVCSPADWRLIAFGFLPAFIAWCDDECTFEQVSTAHD